MDSSYKDFFFFKKFSVFQKGVGLKVNTDGVMIGAWVAEFIRNNIQSLSLKNSIRFLDIGGGTGVISLMLAQTLQETGITFGGDAIDIDKDAFTTCEKNFKNSPWNIYLTSINSSLQEFSSSQEKSFFYDLIVSNPPYFANSLKSDNNKKMGARHTDSLNYKELISCTTRILKDNGVAFFIFPKDVQQNVINLCKTHYLFCKHSCYIYSKQTDLDKDVSNNSFDKSKRIILMLTKGVGDHVNDEIENKNNNKKISRIAIDNCLRLTNNFYL